MKKGERERVGRGKRRCEVSVGARFFQRGKGWNRDGEMDTQTVGQNIQTEAATERQRQRDRETHKMSARISVQMRFH